MSKEQQQHEVDLAKQKDLLQENQRSLRDMEEEARKALDQAEGRKTYSPAGRKMEVGKRAGDLLAKAVTGEDINTLMNSGEALINKLLSKDEGAGTEKDSNNTGSGKNEPRKLEYEKKDKETVREEALGIINDYYHYNYYKDDADPENPNYRHEAKEALALAKREGVEDYAGLERAYKGAVREEALGIINDYYDYNHRQYKEDYANLNYTSRHEAKEALALAKREGVEDYAGLERAYKGAVREEALGIINDYAYIEDRTSRHEAKEALALAKREGVEDYAGLERAYKGAVRKNGDD